MVSPIAMEEKGNYQFKIVLIGDSGVGKTSIIRQYIEGNFDRSVVTHGCDLRSKSLRIGSSRVKVIQNPHLVHNLSFPPSIFLVECLSILLWLTTGLEYGMENAWNGMA